MRTRAVTLVVGLWIVFGASAIEAQSPSPASPAPREDAERTRLETLCQQRARTANDLATCLDVVDRLLAPRAPGPSASAAPAADSVRITGRGQKSSEAFDLGGGDYRATVKVKDTSSGSIGLPCTATGSLKLTDDNSEVGTVTAGARPRKSGTTETYIYGIDAGRYYWDFSLTSCATWDVTLDSIVIDYAEPNPGPIVRSGTGTLDTEAFALTGGDYLVTSVMKAASGDCSLSGYLIPVEEHTLFSSVGDVSAEAKKRKRVTDETRLYAVEPGQFYWSVSASAFAVGDSSCKWTLTLAAQ
jgi:hypothetical protein